MDNKLLSSTALVCLSYLFYLLIGSVSSQKSPCPDIFSYKEDLKSGSNFSQTYGHIDLRDLRIRTTVKLNVELYFNEDVEKQKLVSIRLVKSNKQTLRDIYKDQPAQYRLNFPPADTLPTVLAITVNGGRICSGSPPEGSADVAPIKLEHTMYTPVKRVTNSGKNSNSFQFQLPLQPSYKLPNAFRPSMEQITTVEDLIAVSVSDVGCGTVASGRSRRSINGVRPYRGQFPWAAPVFRVHQMTSTQFLCGSTIITILHVVTAAACIYFESGTMMKTGELSVVPGMYNIDSFFENTNQVRFVAQIHVHSDFAYKNINESDSDIAVLKLDEPVRFNDVVRPICVWDESDDLGRIVGEQGFVSGWGTSKESGISKYPSFVVATIIDTEECSRQLVKPIPQRSRLFCASSNGAVPCFGDIGNGLVMQRGARFYLRGIVLNGQLDWETRMCDAKKPVIYTDVAPFRFWLVHILDL